MTTTSWSLLGLAGLLAWTDWFSVSDLAIRARRLEYVFKPATLAALLALCASVRTTETTPRVWFLVGLAFCLVGDVALMLPGRTTPAFAGGLGAFLLGHAAFIGGLVSGGAKLGSSLLALV